MPSKNIIKTYVADGYYHVYNRGVEKRKIFEDAKDYKVFLNYLMEYLSPPPDPKNLLTSFTLKGGTFKGTPRQPNNFSESIQLVAYCLMPNHFHLLLKQTSKYSIKEFIQSLATRYSIYFNKRHDRVGKLFQGHYKACLITEDSYLLHLSRYIHKNPLETTKDLTKSYSSYADYLGLRKTNWVHPKIVLDFFNKKVGPEFTKVKTYQQFIKANDNSSETLGSLILEN